MPGWAGGMDGGVDGEERREIKEGCHRYVLGERCCALNKAGGRDNESGQRLPRMPLCIADFFVER